MPPPMSSTRGLNSRSLLQSSADFALHRRDPSSSNPRDQTSRTILPKREDISHPRLPRRLPPRLPIQTLRHLPRRASLACGAIVIVIIGLASVGAFFPRARDPEAGVAAFEDAGFLGAVAPRVVEVAGSGAHYFSFSPCRRPSTSWKLVRVSRGGPVNCRGRTAGSFFCKKRSGFCREMALNLRGESV